MLSRHTGWAWLQYDLGKENPDTYGMYLEPWVVEGVFSFEVNVAWSEVDGAAVKGTGYQVADAPLEDDDY